MMSNRATSVNQDERRDTQTARGPKLIFAGSGTRQKHTQLERAIDLIENHGADPEALLIVTQTDKAAHELTKRIRAALNALGIKFKANVMYAGTFLSLCLRVLEEYREHTGLKRNFTIMDAFDQHYFLYQRLDDYLALPASKSVLGRDGARWTQAQTLLKKLNAITEQALDTPALAAAATTAAERALAACYALYRQHLDKANALDGVAAQLAALRLLEGNASVLDHFRRQFAYLIVDPQQPTSVIKERILACFVDLSSLPWLAAEDRPAHAGDGNAAKVVEFPRQPEERGRAGGRTAGADAVPWWLA